MTVYQKKLPFDILFCTMQLITAGNNQLNMPLPPEEYVEQVFFFETFRSRIEDGYAAQECLASIRGELLATAQLPKAVSFLLTEMKHTGLLSSAMQRLPHYFTAFQTFVIVQSEREGGRFDFRIALQILEREAKYRTENPPVQGMFFYQFETICRNRLGYDKGLDVLIQEDIYDAAWKNWLRILRSQIGLADFAEMIFYRSDYYKIVTAKQFVTEKAVPSDADVIALFGEREGRIAYAARFRDPAFLFSALSRHLGYPGVPRQKQAAAEENILPALKRRIELLENRLQLLEDEQHGGINLDKYTKTG
ncbi:MAG: hypothetical protein LBT46_10755 [Planctomycetaceae bacterium]|jgi:hypothetical protein|nr:hypothetical protein [Planctomycetaceae bacterium]